LLFITRFGQHLDLFLSLFRTIMAHCISVRCKTSQGENNRSVDSFPSHLESDFFVHCIILYISAYLYTEKIITASRIYNCRETRSFINFNSIGLYLRIPFKSYDAIRKFWKFYSAYCILHRAWLKNTKKSHSLSFSSENYNLSTLKIIIYPWFSHARWFI